jgi:protocatechuate 3,4-dioxygenase beta subunit
MKRRKLLKSIGLAAMGGSSLASHVACLAQSRVTLKKNDCGANVTPPVPEGPYYKDEQLDRQDITEGKPGVLLTLVFKVTDAHCKPLKDAIVDIWQCDKDGKYSDFERENTAGQKWLRGYQKTDAEGMCTFKTIFPGWYNGRLTHIHGKLRVNGVTRETTNFFLPKEVENAVYKNPLYAKGLNPVTIAQDIELRGDTERHNALMMSVKEDGKGGYLATFTISDK